MYIEVGSLVLSSLPMAAIMSLMGLGKEGDTFRPHLDFIVFSKWILSSRSSKVNLIGIVFFGMMASEGRLLGLRGGGRSLTNKGHVASDAEGIANNMDRIGRVLIFVRGSNDSMVLEAYVKGGCKAFTVCQGERTQFGIKHSRRHYTRANG